MLICEGDKINRSMLPPNHAQTGNTVIPSPSCEASDSTCSSQGGGGIRDAAATASRDEAEGTPRKNDVTESGQQEGPVLPPALVSGSLAAPGSVAIEAPSDHLLPPARQQQHNTQPQLPIQPPLGPAAAAAAAATPSDHGLTFLAVTLTVGILAILARKFMAAMGDSGGLGSISWEAM